MRLFIFSVLLLITTAVTLLLYYSLLKNQPLSFYDYTVVVYSDELDDVFMLEIDSNSKETSPGEYTQYSFLSALVEGQVYNNYDQRQADYAEPQENIFLKTFDMEPAADLSPRTQYEIDLLIGNKEVLIRTKDIDVDFVTRSDVNYTKHHGEGDALVKYDGKEFSAKFLIKRTYAADNTKRIFPPSRAAIQSTSQQFVLWDDEGNFYLIDQTNVQNPAPGHPSHSWLVTKDQSTDAVRKSYSLDIFHSISAAGEEGWIITMPKFKDARLSLTNKMVFSGAIDTSSYLTTVQGEIVDDTSSRFVQGTMYLQQ